MNAAASIPRCVGSYPGNYCCGKTPARGAVVMLIRLYERFCLHINYRKADFFILALLNLGHLRAFVCKAELQRLKGSKVRVKLLDARTHAPFDSLLEGKIDVG
ncbi:hypothetical protein [Pseudomonas sp. PD9R]|uniref:hypothetical protein n=1 Tax=Pseudomonas sp. PD9R TaxID=2853534 RepID=UPI001C47FCF7|nr:hypothetical protein [Pseudomonas sp. PD9R]MBV6823165.1 hypothetical protein [Pseudomonas sp. PD9R]